MIEWGFLVKKIVAAFIMPMPLAFLMLLIASILYWRRKLFLTKLTIFFTVFFLYLISIQFTADLLVSDLENQYPSYQKIIKEPIDYVLVLGSGHTSDESQPISSLLSASGLMRLMEGIRVYRLNPGSKLLLSGYQVRDKVSHAQALRQVASHLGVPAEDMILEGRVKDTREEADHWIRLAKGKRLALVTSASHMPRSMYLFRQAQEDQGVGVHIYPAPTDYISHENSTLYWNDWFPSGRHMYNVERAWHEYLGLLWARLAS